MRAIVAVIAAGVALLGASVASARPVDEHVAVPAAKRAMPSDFRLRADVLTTSVQRDPFRDPEGTMHYRFASSMIDFYPLGQQTGLRMSAGLRYFTVFYYAKDAEAATHGLLYQGFMGGGGAVRTQFARYTPAVTVGYSKTIGRAMFGIEGGSLIGNATASLPRSFSLASNRRGGGANPIANLVFGLRF